MILFDVSIYRQFSAIIFFSFVPGLLLLDILKVRNIQFFKRIVLALGLSISFLAFFGLILNILYQILNILKPLSLISLLSFFNFIIFILIFLNYSLNKHFNYNFVLKLEKGNAIVLIFPVIFPLLSILGTYLMNTIQTNFFLIILLLIIPIYLIIIYYWHKKFHDFEYLFSIWMISISLLLFTGLTSNYLYGRDVYNEFRAFETVFQNSVWSLSNYNSVLTATLSTSLLPAIYEILTGIEALYVYKIIYPFLFSFVPVVMYLLFRNYLDELNSFLSSFLFVAQSYFIYESHSAMRQNIALLFLSLFLMILFDIDVKSKIKKNFFLIIFLIMITLSHYSAAYILFIILAFVWCVKKLITITLNIQETEQISANIIILFIVFIYFWYSIATQTHFVNLIGFLQDMFQSTTSFFIEETRQPAVYKILGKNLINIPEIIYVTVHDIIFLFIGIGTLAIITNRKKFKFDSEYLLMICISLFLLASLLVFPIASKRYGMLRLFQELVIIIGSTFIIGLTFVCERIKIKNSTIFILIILILQFFSASFLIYQFFGVPQSGVLNHDGLRHYEFYIYDQEVESAQFLVDHKNEIENINSDSMGSMRFIYVNPKNKKINMNNPFLINNTYTSGYLYLRAANTQRRIIYPSFFYDAIKPISDYEYLLERNNKIYDNSISMIYYK